MGRCNIRFSLCGGGPGARSVVVRSMAIPVTLSDILIRTRESGFLVEPTPVSRPGESIPSYQEEFVNFWPEEENVLPCRPGCRNQRAATG